MHREIFLLKKARLLVCVFGFLLAQYSETRLIGKSGLIEKQSIICCYIKRMHTLKKNRE